MLDLKRIFPINWPTAIELQDDEYQRGPRIRVGELDMESESSVLDVRPRQRWTKDKPTKPGYWWVKVEGCDPRVVEVFLERGKLWMAGADFRPELIPDGLLWGTVKISEPA